MSSLILLDLNDRQPHPVIRILTPQGTIEIRCTGERTVMHLYRGDNVRDVSEPAYSNDRYTYTAWQGYKQQHNEDLERLAQGNPI